MSNPAVIGLDIAKNVFQVHGANAEGRCVLRRRLRRAEVVMFFARIPQALVGIEACPSGHHWAFWRVAARQGVFVEHRIGLPFLGP